jgi:hypothetical protein
MDRRLRESGTPLSEGLCSRPETLGRLDIRVRGEAPTSGEHGDEANLRIFLIYCIAGDYSFCTD